MFNFHVSVVVEGGRLYIPRAVIKIHIYRSVFIAIMGAPLNQAVSCCDSLLFTTCIWGDHRYASGHHFPTKKATIFSVALFNAIPCRLNNL